MSGEKRRNVKRIKERTFFKKKILRRSLKTFSESELKNKAIEKGNKTNLIEKRKKLLHKSRKLKKKKKKKEKTKY